MSQDFESIIQEQEILKEQREQEREAENMNKIIKKYDVKCCPLCGGNETLVKIEEYIPTITIRCNKCRTVINCPSCGSNHVAYFEDIAHWICCICAFEFDKIERYDF